MTFEELLQQINLDSFTTQFIKEKCKEHGIDVGKKGISVQKRLEDLGYIKTNKDWHLPKANVYDI